MAQLLAYVNGIVLRAHEMDSRSTAAEQLVLFD
jgi:hypothetical protein